MIFHVSIEAQEPQRVAEAIAHIWGGVAMPLDRLVEGGWISYCGGDPLSAVEVFPLGTDIRPTAGEHAPWSSESNRQPRPTASHVALGSSLDEQELVRFIESNGWRAKYVTRGDRFGVMEMWVSEYLVIEWLTVDMQLRYRKTVEAMVSGTLHIEAPGAPSP
ncbi:MAG: hypothetical protein ACT6UH_25230 [Hydrogenophaga sp.]|uniref:hypothetical protein n=1 Tax=Hydrogenophaga sp. TaxID=1904254 RepID=UPI0040368684